MYLDFYRLKRAPFHITPDPTLLFLSASHKAALGAIAYGIEARQGFVAITGDVGVGKTTMLRAYLTRVDPQRLKTIFLLNAHLSFLELLTRMFHSFGVQVATDDPAVLVTQMQQLLRQEYARGRNVALIIDEAQHLPLETLEQLRLLSNLTTAGEQPLQIVLVGQPELEQHLQRRALHRLAQRLVIRATIVPLTTAESLAYIRHRVAKVALPGGPIFTPGALKAIVRHAHGVPRVVNILCTNVLLAGFGAQQQPITAGLAQQVITAFMGVQPFPLGRVGLAASAGLVLVAGLLWLAPFRPGPPATRPSPAARAHPGSEAPRRTSAPPLVPPSLQPPGPTPQAREESTTDIALAQDPDEGPVRLMALEAPERQRPETPRVTPLPRVTPPAPVSAMPHVTLSPLDTPLPPTPTTGITSPRHGATVGQKIAVAGVLPGLRPDQHAFLCVKSQAFGRLIYPQGPIMPDATGKWRVASIYGSPGYRYETFVVVTTDTASAALLRNPRVRKYGIRSLPPSTAPLGPVIVVTRE